MFPCRLCPDGLYTYAVDIWSCGCIFAELLGRNPLFPGKNFVHQLSLVFDIIGSPKDNEVGHITNVEAKKFLRDQSKKVKVPFHKIFPNASHPAIELLDGLLLFNPDKRLTVDESLQSLFLCQYYLPKSYSFPTISEQELEFSFERKSSVTRSQLKNLIQQEISSLKREKMAGISGASGNPHQELPQKTSRKSNITSSNSIKNEEVVTKNNAPTYIRSTTSSSQRSQSAPRLRQSDNVARQAKKLGINNMENVSLKDVYKESIRSDHLQTDEEEIPTKETRRNSELNTFRTIVKESNQSLSDQTNQLNDVNSKFQHVANSVDTMPPVVGTLALNQQDTTAHVVMPVDSYGLEFINDKYRQQSDFHEGIAESTCPANTNLLSPVRKRLIETYTSPKRLIDPSKVNSKDSRGVNSFPSLSTQLDPHDNYSPERHASSPSSNRPASTAINKEVDDVANIMENIFRASWQQKYVSTNSITERQHVQSISSAAKEKDTNLRHTSSSDDSDSETLPRSRDHPSINSLLPNQQKDFVANDIEKVQNPPIQRKRLTVPKSPKFSKMSWQRKQSVPNEIEGNNNVLKKSTAILLEKKRAASVCKGRPF